MNHTNATRLRRVQIAGDLVLQFLRRGTPGATVIENPLPDDAEIIAVDFDRRDVGITFRSDSFDVVPEGGPIPNHIVRYRLDWGSVFGNGT